GFVREDISARTKTDVPILAAAGREMALHTNFQLPISIQVCRVDYCRTNQRFIGGVPCGSVLVLRTRTVAALAIYPTRKGGEDWLSTRFNFRGLALRVGIMAEDAILRYHPMKILLVRSFISWRHRPV